MKIGTAYIKENIAQKGFYGELILEVELQQKTGIKIIHTDCSKKWQNAIEAGVNYFYDKELKNKKVGLHVRVVDCNDMIIDSSFMVFFYLSYSALCSAMSIKEKIKIDNDGNFVIPK